MRTATLALAFAATAAALAFSGRSGAQPAAPPLALQWPVQCRLGVDCEIERYVDDNPATPGARDYACGTRTQDGHTGVDIRLADVAAQRRGVTVVAAADGRVQSTRDGVADVSDRITGRQAVDGIGCGNAVVVAHPGGFQTIYCHMAKGSVLVRSGDTVKAGQPIGRIGLSGLTEYPHLHFEVHQNGAMVDPFAYGAAAGACGGGVSLWRDPLPYRPEVIASGGFSATNPTRREAIDGDPAPPDAASPTIFAYARPLGLKAGDVETMTFTLPNGSTLRGALPPVAAGQSEDLPHIGQRRPPGGWPAGRYQATLTVTDKSGRMVMSRSFAFDLPARDPPVRQ